MPIDFLLCKIFYYKICTGLGGKINKVKSIDSKKKSLNYGNYIYHVNGKRVFVRKLSNQEVKAYKKIYRRGLFKKYSLKTGMFFTSFLVLTLFSFLFFNYKSINNQIGFDENKNIESFVAEKINQHVAGADDTNFVATDQRLEIPKLNIIGNIIYPKNEVEVEGYLDEGIVHLPQSVLPGNEGNSILTAHSSSTKQGYYSNIFSTINKLEKGDIFFLYKGKDFFAYRVIDKEVIKPRLEYLKKANENEMLTLVTCWPIGTDVNRLAIYSERVK